MYIKEFSFISSSQAYLLYEMNLHLFDHVVTYSTILLCLYDDKGEKTGADWLWEYSITSLYYINII